MNNINSTLKAAGITLLLFFITFKSVKAQPEWSKNVVLYEMNVRQFSPEGTFAAAMNHLPRLKEMGIDVVWLMPIHPIGMKNRKGSLGSYYAVKDYRKINPEFGKEIDFNAFVEEAHRLGLKVIIDWVANHTSPDHPWVTEKKADWYNRDSIGQVIPPPGTDWFDVADLNYNSKAMRKQMISDMCFWLTEYNIDGFRCDVADWVPVDFWNEARMALDKIKPVFMLAEAENPDHHDRAFDMSYAWEFHHILNEVAQGKKSALHLGEYIAKEKSKFPTKAYRLSFTDNHDENSWNGTTTERLGQLRFSMAALSATCFGMPLLYSGQEADLQKRLRFFEKDTIPWNGYSLQRFYSYLFHLKKNNPALWNGAYGVFPAVENATPNESTFAFSRIKDEHGFYAVFNFSPQPQWVEVIWNKEPGQVQDVFSGQSIFIPKQFGQLLQPYEFRLLSQKIKP